MIRHYDDVCQLINMYEAVNVRQCVGHSDTERSADAGIWWLFFGHIIKKQIWMRAFVSADRLHWVGDWIWISRPLRGYSSELHRGGDFQQPIQRSQQCVGELCQHSAPSTSHQRLKRKLRDFTELVSTAKSLQSSISPESSISSTFNPFFPLEMYRFED